MNPGASILIVDDDETFRETLASQLRRRFGSVRTAASTSACMAAIEESEPDVVLMDLHLGADDGLETMERVAALVPGSEIIVVTGFGTVDAAVAAMRRGAFDFVTKPLNLETLVQAILRAAERRDLRRQNVALRRMLRRGNPIEMLGGSAAMSELRDLAGSAAGSDATVLITGPSGVGKELVARMIHAESPRAGREMVVVNCAALQESLLESELFGHERGAFTGAGEQRQGLVEAAHNATLFLDEVGELPLALQAKLLRSLQFGEVRRVGGTATLKVDVRFVAATNRDLEAAVRERGFREDLYYRLNVIAIRVPPLAERLEDVEPIFAHLARRAGLAYELAAPHFRALRAYSWPGNVREIENLVERLKIREGDGVPPPERLLALLGSGAAAQSPLRTLEEVERETIERALGAAGGDRDEAARTLGISVRKLYYRLAAYKSSEGSPPDES